MPISRTLAAVAVAFMVAFNSFALTPVEATVIRSALEASKAAELPRTAEVLLREAAKGERAETARVILKFVSAKRASASASVLAALRKVYPTMFVVSRPVVTRSFAERVAGGRRITDLGNLGGRFPQRPNGFPNRFATPPVPPTPALPEIGSSGAGSVLVGGDVIPIPAIGVAQSTVLMVVVTQSNQPINTIAGGNGTGSFEGMIAIPANSGPIHGYDQPRQ